jgi:hexulose-6-phosphate isomerase
MKYGINKWAFPQGMTLKESLRLARSVGCDHLEPNLEERGELSLATSPAKAASIAKLARAAGIELSSLSTGLYWKYSPLANDPSIRDQAARILKHQLVTAASLAVDTILVVPGSVTADVAYDLAYERAQRFIESGLRTAESTGVTIAVENVWNKFLLSPLEMHDFIDSFQSRYVASYFDVGNVLAFGYPQHWIRILAKRIRRVHVKDYDEQAAGLSGFRNLLQGSIDWPEVRRALHDIGYDGYITAEVSGYPSAPQLGLRHVIECLHYALADENAGAAKQRALSASTAG